MSASHHSLRTTASAVLGTTVGVLPVFLLGGLAVQMRADLAFGQARLGLAVAVFFAASALCSVVAGRLVERAGASAGLVASAALAAGATLGIAVLADSFEVLIVLLALGGVGNAGTQVAANLLLARGVQGGHQGLAFGIKQAAIPLSTLLAGAAVPLVALTVGWRWAYTAAAVLALISLAVTPRRGDGAGGPAAQGQGAHSSTAPLIVLAVAAGLGAGAANSLGAFLVDSSVDAGVAPGQAGALLSVGSAAGVAARVATGWLADRRGGAHLPVVAQMLAGGSGGFALLALGGSGAALVAGTLVAFAAGWGWNGLFNFAVVRRNPGAPAAATGITQTGVYLGGVVGPLCFGALVERASYATAWLAAGGALLAAAALVLAGRQLLLREPVPAG